MQDYYAADFVSGIITAGYLVLGLFFFRFWRRTADSLFLNFGWAFWLLAVNHGLAALLHVDETGVASIYLLRLAAFVIIAAAIVRKNLHPSR